MSPAEPTAIGTVVEAGISGYPDDVRTILVRVHGGPQPWYEASGSAVSCRTEWRYLRNPVVVHEGYTPPTPEPQRPGAVVRDGNGWVHVSIYDTSQRAMRWHMVDDACDKCPWDALKQPVEVLFEAVA